MANKYLEKLAGMLDAVGKAIAKNPKGAAVAGAGLAVGVGASAAQNSVNKKRFNKNMSERGL